VHKRENSEGDAPILFLKETRMRLTADVMPLFSMQVLDVEVVMLNEFLGAYPAYATGVSTCPFFSFKRYQLNKDQHYSFVDTANTGGGETENQQPGPVTPPAQGAYPYPTDAACIKPQPPQQLPCPAMVSCYQHKPLVMHCVSPCAIRSAAVRDASSSFTATVAIGDSVCLVMLKLCRFVMCSCPPTK
jgi:hypothetical protein